MERGKKDELVIWQMCRFLGVTNGKQEDNEKNNMVG
jgi:hypothetical protein